jgi:hypothetical protein
MVPTGWPVAADYEITGGLVVPLDERGRRISHHRVDERRLYMPVTRPELPGEFAKLAGKADADVLAGTADAAVLTFVRRYGLLGYADALTPLEAHALASARTTPTYDQFIDKSYDSTLVGDPVAWILGHAASVAFILALAGALDSPNNLRHIFEQRIVAEGDVEELRYVYAIRGWTRPRLGRQPVPNTNAERRATALRIIAWLLAKNLSGVTREIGMEATALASYFRFNNLLDQIYWMLADAVTGHRIRQCRECGRFFIAATDRVKYCPRPMGLRGVVSLCMHRAKVRTWRQQKTRRARRHLRSTPRRTSR